MIVPNFRSEYGEDRWIYENVKLPEKGFYLDVGCASPVNDSNTFFLRELGWEGIGIDANPFWRHEWSRLDPVKHAFFFCAVAKEPLVKFEVNEKTPGQSRISPAGAWTRARELSDILQEFKSPPIDFLSLDVEGNEFEALQSLNYHSWPSVIVSEYSTAGLPDDFRVRDFLLGNNYRVAHQTKANLIYLKNDALAQ